MPTLPALIQELRLGSSLNLILVNHLSPALELGTQKKGICDPPSTLFDLNTGYRMV